MQPWQDQLLADLILALHAVIVFFNVAALPVIWIGHVRKWRFVRNPWFRITHLALIGFIAAESLLGMVCPLTSWEEQLRARAGQPVAYPGGFVAHWVHRLLFYDFHPSVFVMAYVLFFLLVLATLFWVKPSWPARRRG